MRFFNVTIFLVVAAWPVGVGAHAEPSNIVAPDGQFEVQRHLGVQERAHDKDDDERTSPLVEETISSNALAHLAEILELDIINSNALKHPAEISEPTIINSNALKRPAEMLESETRPTKIRKHVETNFRDYVETEFRKHVETEFRDYVETKFRDFVETEFVTKAKKVYLLNKETVLGEQPRYPFSYVTSSFKEKFLPMMFEEANKHYLKMGLDPKQVFELYGLNFAGDKLFEEPQLVYWAKYMDAFNEAMRNEPMRNEPLLDTLLEFYSVIILAKAVVKVPNDEVALRVQDEIGAVWYGHFSPDDAFTYLRLHQAGDELFDNRLFLFWTRYVIYCNSRVDEASKVSMLSVLEKHFDLPTLLGKIKRKPSDVTQHFEKELKDTGMEYWIN